MKHRLARLRRAMIEPGTNGQSCALWIVVGFAEPHGYQRYGVWARFLTAPDSPILGRGRTIRPAVRDAERTVARGEWPS